MIRGARVIIIKENKVLLIHRLKDGREYYVIPGGTIEPGETPEQAAIREAKEETNFDVEIEPFWEMSEDVKGEIRKLYFFKVKSFQGELKLGGPEAEIHCAENNYHLEWIPLTEIKDLLLYPEGIKEKLISFNTIPADNQP